MRNYAAMTKELEDLKVLLDKKGISETEYNLQKEQIAKDMHDYKYKKTGFKMQFKKGHTNIFQLALNILNIIIVVIGLIFTILPMETFGFATLAIALLITLISIYFNKDKKAKFYKHLLIVIIAIALVGLGKLLFMKEEVVKDKKFKQTIQQSQQEDLKDLEGL